MGMPRLARVLLVVSLCVSCQQFPTRKTVEEAANESGNVRVSFDGDRLLLQSEKGDELDDAQVQFEVAYGTSEFMIEPRRVRAENETEDGIGNPQRFTALERHEWAQEFEISPSGNQILMSILSPVQLPDGSVRFISRLWTQDIANRGTNRKSIVTDGDYIDRTPAYSHDGRYAFFSSNRNGTPAIFRVSLDRRGRFELVVDSSTADYEPMLSGDGARLVYTAQPRAGGVQGQIWIRPIEAGMPTMLVQGAQPRLSPDPEGSRILFTRRNEDTGYYHIWLMDGATGKLDQLTSGSNNNVDPAWSPDGQFIVFSSDRGQTSEGVRNLDVWRLDLMTNSLRRLTDNASVDDNARFLDADTIMFRSNRGRQWDVWSMELTADDA